METMDVYKFIQELIGHSKERPRMYGGTPEGLVAMWTWLDMVSLFILNKDFQSYQMGTFGGEKYDMGAMDFLTYIKREEHVDSEIDIYNRLVGLRTEYEHWLNNKLLKD